MTASRGNGSIYLCLHQDGGDPTYDEFYTNFLIETSGVSENYYRISLLWVRIYLLVPMGYIVYNRINLPSGLVKAPFDMILIQKKR